MIKKYGIKKIIYYENGQLVISNTDITCSYSRGYLRMQNI